MRDLREGSSAMVTACLLAVMGLEIVHLFLGAEWARSGSHLAMLLVVPVTMRQFGVREVYLLCLCGVLAVLLWQWHPHPWEAARVALDQAVFLMAFILLLSLVQEAAMTSGSVRDCGMFLARQPGGRRFLGLFVGTNLMSVAFNLGTLSLLAPLVRRAAEDAPDDPLTPVRERRQLSAMLRGFAWSVIWSPTAVAPLTLLTLIDGINRGRWIAMGVGIAAVMMIIGWAEDRVRWRGQTAAARGLPPIEPAPFPRAAFGRFSMVCLSLAAMVGMLIEFAGKGVPASLMAASPVLLIGWLAVQHLRTGRPVLAGTIGRVAEIARIGLPQSAPAAVTLACSGFVGRAGAALIPSEALAEWVGLDTMPAWVFMIGTTLSVTALSQFALSPIMMAVFFGAVLGALPSLPADPTLTALAIATGWATSTTFSPFASGVILMTRITGHPGARLTYRWNGVFTGLTFLALTALYWLLTGGT